LPFPKHRLFLSILFYKVKVEFDLKTLFTNASVASSNNGNFSWQVRYLLKWKVILSPKWHNSKTWKEKRKKKGVFVVFQFSCVFILTLLHNDKLILRNLIWSWIISQRFKCTRNKIFLNTVQVGYIGVLYNSCLVGCNIDP
jgi:hypothetical protein